MWWRADRSMAVSAQLLLIVLRALSASSLEQSAEALGHQSEAVLTAGGKFVGVGGRKGIMRRHASERADDALQADFAESQMQSTNMFHGVTDEDVRKRKMERGAALRVTPDSPWQSTVATTNDQKNSHDAPAWSPHSKMPAMQQCIQDVTQDMGLSDYGRTAHSCSACVHNCTAENSQKATNMTWLLEPSLTTCNAFDVELFTNWSNIDQLGCDHCGGKGLRHAFEFSIATNAGEGVPGYEDKVLSFNGWMGPEVAGGPRGAGSDFAGLHVIEVEDTELPSHSDNCKAQNPPGRWLAIPGELRAGETFTCDRICKSPHGCKCGRNTAMRCTAGIAMSSGQIFGYRLRYIAESATGTLNGNSYVGTEWEVTAEDITQTSPNQAEIMVVGRIILAGNSNVYGIKSLRQSHQHLGCVECDLFYEETIVTGPFIHQPPGVHVVRSADGTPPPLTSESCELFRISAISGLAVKFETGPGLWPPFEVNDTIFTCNHVSTNTCPSFL